MADALDFSVVTPFYHSRNCKGIFIFSDVLVAGGISKSFNNKINENQQGNHKRSQRRPFYNGLEFLGWEILATIPAGLGWLWLAPYITMSKTNAYHALLKEAVDSGRLTAEDFKE